MKIKLDLLPEEATALRDWVAAERAKFLSVAGDGFGHLGRAIFHLEHSLKHEIARYVPRKTEPLAPKPRGGLAP